MRCLIGLALVFISNTAPVLAKSAPHQKLVYSNTSFDGGFVHIEVSSDGKAKVEWSSDPFRRGKAKKLPWTRRMTLLTKETTELFNSIAETPFLEMKRGREQIPDEPSVTIELLKLKPEKIEHSVTYPAREVPKELDPLVQRFIALYEQAHKVPKKK